MGKVTYSLRLPNEEYDEVIRAAQVQRLTIAQWLREAVKEKVKRDIRMASSRSNRH